MTARVGSPPASPSPLASAPDDVTGGPGFPAALPAVFDQRRQIVHTVPSDRAADHLALARSLRGAGSAPDAARVLAAIEEAGPPPAAATRSAIRDVLCGAAFVQRTADAPAPIDVLGAQLPAVYPAVARLSFGDALEDVTVRDEGPLAALLAVLLDAKTSEALVGELLRQALAAGKADLVTHVVGVRELRKLGVGVETPAWLPRPAGTSPVLLPLTAPPEILTWRTALTSGPVLALAGFLLFLCGLILGLLQYP
ncbi:hypothetical protein [Actinosynnema sp. NPDC023587]|uniref:hypothetical protein n=1 Tax=Actinosynnema sp. NPDC023587 TaxID=3154695 RepID=UPI0033C4E5EB